MDSNARPKMSMSNRAKQFAPFDALKGFQEALRKKEKTPIPKKELAEEKARKKRGRGIALLVASVIPIFLGALMDELWFMWTNDAFAMIGVGIMFVMIGTGVYDLVTAGAQKQAVCELLKE